MSTWLLVADGLCGRLFSVDRAMKMLIEIKEFLNPEGRLQEKELISDAPGRTFDRKGQGRHIVEGHVKKKEFSKEQFSYELAKYLNEKHQAKEFNRLIIVAPSKTLGYMNKKLNSNYDVTKIAKEMTNLSAAELFDVLENDLLAHKLI